MKCATTLNSGVIHVHQGQGLEPNNVVERNLNIANKNIPYINRRHHHLLGQTYRRNLMPTRLIHF